MRNAHQNTTTQITHMTTDRMSALFQVLLRSPMAEIKEMAKVAGNRPPYLPNAIKATMLRQMQIQPRHSGARYFSWPGGTELLAPSAIAAPISASSTPRETGKKPGPIWLKVPI